VCRAACGEFEINRSGRTREYLRDHADYAQTLRSQDYAYGRIAGFYTAGTPAALALRHAGANLVVYHLGGRSRTSNYYSIVAPMLLVSLSKSAVVDLPVA
jgi:hypothetical protein